MRKVKIFLTTLAVAGVLFATTSCVDDSESASVTDLRGAKSAQLKALAALNQAEGEAAKIQAEAAKIQAEATKVLYEAQAEQAKAYAEYNLAQARYQDALTADKTASTAIMVAQAAEQLRIAKAQADYQEAYTAREVAYYEGLLATTLVNAEANLIAAQTQLKLAKAQGNSEISWRLDNLLGQYYNLIANTNTYKNQIVLYEIQLARYELDLVKYPYDSAAFVNNYIINTNANIRSSEKDIKGYNERIAEWQAFAQDPDASEIIEEKQAELEKLVDTLPVLYKAIAPAYSAWYDTARVIRDSIQTLLSDYENLSYGYYTIRHYQDIPGAFDTEDEWEDAAGAVFTHRGPSVNGNTAYYYSGYSTALGTDVYSQYWYGTYYWATVAYTSDSYYVDEGKYVSKEDFEYQKRNIKDDSIGAAKEVNDYTTLLYALLPKIKPAGAAEVAADALVKTTLEARNKAQDDYSKSNSKADSTKLANAGRAYNGINPINGAILDPDGGAYGAWQVAKARYVELQDSIRPLNQNIINAKNNLNYYTGQLESYYNNLELISKGPREKIWQELQDAIAVANEKYGLYWDASNAYSGASALTGTIRNEILALSELEGLLIDGSDQTYYTKRTADYIQNQIESYTKLINTAQANIDRWKIEVANAALYATGNGYIIAQLVENYKYNIGETKVWIEEAQKRIEVYETQLALVKKSIDVLLAEE
jgi:hypothetical protein